MDRRLRILLLGALAWPGGASAATAVDGGDIGGQVWTADGSPYMVGNISGDPIVPAGKALRIEAGTTVLFSDPAVPLLVEGTLTVNGTEAAPVTMQATSDDTPLMWQGIRLASSGDATLRITGAVIRNAMNGVKLWGGHAQIERSTFENCRFGISVASSYNDYAFDSLTFRANSVGFECAFCARVRLTNVLAQGHSSHAVVLYGTGEVTLVNATLDANQNGVDVWPSGLSGAPTKMSIVNAILSNNAEAIELDLRGGGGTATVAVSYTTFWGNRTANLLVKPRSGDFVITEGTVAPAGTGNAVADPKYSSASDLRLSASSQCVDSAIAAGAPNHDLERRVRPIDGDGLPDSDGSAYDRGAYEFDPTSGGAGGVGGNGNAGDGGAGDAGTGGAAGADGVGAFGGSVSGTGGDIGVGTGGAAGDTSGSAGEGGAGGEASGHGGTSASGSSGGGSGAVGSAGSGGQLGGTGASAGNGAGVGAGAGIGGGAGGSTGPAAPHATVQRGGCGCRSAPGSRNVTGSLVALALLGIAFGRRQRF